MITLEFAERGVKYQVVSIADETLSAMGVFPGMEVEILNKDLTGATFQVKIGFATYALRKASCKNITVKRLQSPETYSSHRMQTNYSEKSVL